VISRQTFPLTEIFFAVPFLIRCPLKAGFLPCLSSPANGFRRDCSGSQLYFLLIRTPLCVLDFSFPFSFFEGHCCFVLYLGKSDSFPFFLIEFALCWIAAVLSLLGASDRCVFFVGASLYLRYVVPDDRRPPLPSLWLNVSPVLLSRSFGSGRGHLTPHANF